MTITPEQLDEMVKMADAAQKIYAGINALRSPGHE
jgi:hypothetical protein